MDSKTCSDLDKPGPPLKISTATCRNPNGPHLPAQWVASTIGTLIAVGSVHPLYWWLAAGLTIAWFGYRGYLVAAAELRAAAFERRRLADELDRQDRWYVQGDERGVYGHFPPAV